MPVFEQRLHVCASLVIIVAKVDEIDDEVSKENRLHASPDIVPDMGNIGDDIYMMMGKFPSACFWAARHVAARAIKTPAGPPYNPRYMAACASTKT